MIRKNIKPKISVITVCYNSEKTIALTIESVLQQNYDNYEYFIIDGKSTDNTIGIVKSYIEKFDGKLKYISEKDSGIYNAMNKGIKMCTGDIIGIINSDDYYDTNTFGLVAERYCEEDYPFLIINGDMERVDKNNNVVYRYKFSKKMVEKKECFGHPSMFAAKAVYEEIGLYDENYKLAADGDWQYRAHENPKIKYVLINKVFNHMREGGASDNFKYRWKWFGERVKMKMRHKRGCIISIVLEEFGSVIRTDVKNILPKSLMKIMYKIRYMKKC